MKLRILAFFFISQIVAGCIGPSATEEKLACSASAGEKIEVDNTHSIFGVAINHPLMISECPKSNVHGSYIYRFSKTVCYQKVENKSSCEPLNNGKAYVKFPVMSLPYWTKEDGVTAHIIDGNVEGIRVRTAGISAQEEAYKALSEKYGEPVTKNYTLIQNYHGAKFQSLSAGWVSSDLNITLLGSIGRLDAGQVQIATEKGLKAFKEDAEAIRKKLNRF